MKKCPNCQKTFDDNMKFCQVDGTPLVVVAENPPKEDPYATMVANKSDLQIPPEEPELETNEEPDEAADPYAAMVAGSADSSKEEDILEIPDDDDDDEIDPMKTMVVGRNTSDNIRVNIPEEESKETPSSPPPVSEPPTEPEEEIASEAETVLSPEIPKFNEPDIAPPNMAESTPQTETKDATPKQEEPKPTPGSPFKVEKPISDAKPKSKLPDDPKPTPIPSPFDNSMPPGFAPPSSPPFEPPKEALKPEPLNSTSAEEETPQSPFADPEEPVIESNTEGWSPPSAPVASAGNQGIEQQNFSADVPASTEGKNQTFAIVSLVSGILSMLCCVSIITGPLGVIMGFMARSKASESPNEYGGETLALIGMITGVLGTLLFIIVFILYFLGFAGGLF